MLLGKAYNNIGTLLHQLGQFQEASAFQQQSLNVMDALMPTDALSEGKDWPPLLS
jgi:hypothetical protein